jgi:hypothetical protein
METTLGILDGFGFRGKVESFVKSRTEPKD